MSRNNRFANSGVPVINNEFVNNIHIYIGEGTVILVNCVLCIDSSMVFVCMSTVNYPFFFIN